MVGTTPTLSPSRFQPVTCPRRSAIVRTVTMELDIYPPAARRCPPPIRPSSARRRRSCDLQVGGKAMLRSGGRACPNRTGIGLHRALKLDAEVGISLHELGFEIGEHPDDVLGDQNLAIARW